MRKLLAYASLGVGLIGSAAFAQYGPPAQLNAADPAANRLFGSAVAVSGDTFAISAAGAGGGVYIFRWNGTSWVQQQKIPAANGQSGFGADLAMDGDTLAVGSALDDTAATDAGAVYIYTRSAGTWSLQTRIVASNAATLNHFGESVTLQGDTLVVAAPATLTNQGSLYAYTRAGTTWSEQAILPTVPGAAAGDKIGEKGSLSLNGDTLAAGLPSKAGASGRVAIFQRHQSTWTPDASLLSSPDVGTDTTGRFGSDVSIVGNWLAVGANASNVSVTGGGGVYLYNRIDGAWQTPTRIAPTTLTTGNAFGYSVVLNGNTVLAGAPGSGTNVGASYAFTYADGAWTQQASLIPATAAAGDAVGWSVGLAGNTAIVGAEADDVSGFTDAGAAFVFSRDGDQWLHGVTTVTGTGTAANDFFGASLDVSGKYAVIGAYGTDGPAGGDQGAIYVFNETGNVWTQQGAKILAPGATALSRFGRAVAIDGDTIIAGAPTRAVPNTDQGAAYAFFRNGTTWPQQGATFVANDGAAGDKFGIAVAVSGDTAAIGAYQKNNGSFTDAGAVYVFNRSGTAWTQGQRLATSETATNDFFGFSVGISGDNLVAGAYNRGTGTGAVYVFAREGGSFRQSSKLNVSDKAAGDNFGYSVDISGDVIVVGSPQAASSGFGKAGAAYVFIRNTQTGAWQQAARLNALDASGNANFGINVAVDGMTIAIGANAAGIGSFGTAGAVYTFISASGLPQGPWIQVNKMIRPTPAAADELGFAVSVSGVNVVGGAWKNNSSTGLVLFGDSSDSGFLSTVNMANGNTYATLNDALNASSAGQTIVASAGAFNAQSIDFAGRRLSVNSRSSIGIGNLQTLALNDGAQLQAAANYPVNIYGLIRTANDEGRSVITGSRVNTFGPVFVGKHELSLNALASSMAGSTSLQNAGSTLSSTGDLDFRGPVSDLVGAAIGSSGSMGFWNGANLSKTNVTAGQTLSIGSLVNMSTVNVAANAINVNGSGKWIVSGTSLGAVTNAGRIVTAGATSFSGSILNQAGATIDVSAGSANLYGALTDNGTITGTFSGCPSCLTGFATAFKVDNDWSLGASAAPAIVGGMVQIGRSFDATGTDAVNFDMIGGGIRISSSGQGASTFEAMSHDFGPAGAAFKHDIDGSFPIGTLEIGPAPTTVSLVDRRDNDVSGQNTREAIYVNNLVIGEGSALITGGIKVYARNVSIAGSVDNINNVITLGGPCDADLAIDSVVDDVDFALFVSAYNVADCSDAAMPRLGGGGCRADLNFDGVVDDADFQVFVVAYDRLMCD